MTSSADIIAKTAEINMIRVDGADISGLFTPVAHNHFFSHARIKMPYGPHSIVSTDGDGFIASQYYIRRQQCYAFPVGSALREMQNSLAINETDMVSWLDTVLVCNGSEVTMSVESLYEPDSVVWYLGDGTHATGQQLSHVLLCKKLLHTMDIAVGVAVPQQIILLRRKILHGAVRRKAQLYRRLDEPVLPQRAGIRQWKSHRLRSARACPA